MVSKFKLVKKINIIKDKAEPIKGPAISFCY